MWSCSVSSWSTNNWETLILPWETSGKPKIIHEEDSASTCCRVYNTDHLKPTVRNIQIICERTAIIAYNTLDKQTNSTKDKENERLTLHNEHKKSRYLDIAFQTINQETAFTTGVMKRLQKIQHSKNEIISTSVEIQSKYYMWLHFKDT